MAASRNSHPDKRRGATGSEVSCDPNNFASGDWSGGCGAGRERGRWQRSTKHRFFDARLEDVPVTAFDQAGAERQIEGEGEGEGEGEIEGEGEGEGLVE